MFGLLPVLSTVSGEAQTYASGIGKAPESLGDKLKYGLEIALIGIGIVFLILVILMAVLYIFKLVFARSKQPAEAGAVLAQQAAPAVSADVGLSEKIPEKKLIAIITSAIAASRGVKEADFDVISVEKIS